MKKILYVLLFVLAIFISPAVGFTNPFSNNKVEVNQSSDADNFENVQVEDSGDSISSSIKKIWGWGKKKVESIVDKAKEQWKSIKEKISKLKAKTDFIREQAKGFWGKIKNISGWFKQKPLSDKEVNELKKIAKDNIEHSWSPGQDISSAVNAHYTNTKRELEDALKSDNTWFECDVRQEGPFRDLLHIGEDADRRPITAHDPFQANGLLFDDWVKITSQSGRGMKIDLKENEALDGVLETLDKYKVDEKKLIMNIGVPGDTNNASSDTRLSKIRKLFPNCIVNLSPNSKNIVNGHYGTKTINELIEYAKTVKKPVMFPLNAKYVTEEIVAKLKPYGKVAIWNSPFSFNPKDVKAEIAKFRKWGVDGMIDLMSSH